jgi:hypothetical protein
LSPFVVVSHEPDHFLDEADPRRVVNMAVGLVGEVVPAVVAPPAGRGTLLGWLP